MTAPGEVSAEDAVRALSRRELQELRQRPTAAKSAYSGGGLSCFHVSPSRWKELADGELRRRDRLRQRQRQLVSERKKKKIALGVVVIVLLLIALGSGGDSS